MIDPNTGIYHYGDRVKFFGFIPDLKCKREVSLMLERLENKSPAFSAMSVNFFRDGDNYHGEILITSGEHVFISKEVGTRFLPMLGKLERKMARKLRQWKQIRSILPSIRSSMQPLSV